MGGLSRADFWEAAMARIDFGISGRGTVYLLHPPIRGTHAWIARQLPGGALRLGGTFAIDSRYIDHVGGGPFADEMRVR
jgi:hypothetical protein